MCEGSGDTSHYNETAQKDGTLDVHVCLVSPPPVKVLTTYHDDDWYLPRFKYTPASSYKSSLCCRDLQRALSPQFEDVMFSVVAELHPDDLDSLSYFYNPDGLHRVTLVEAQIEVLQNRQLPSHAKWMDVEEKLEMLESMIHEYNYIASTRAIARFLDCFDPTGTVASYRQFDWFSRAAGYLKSVVRHQGLEPTSDVLREASVSLAEVFKVNTSAGWYYLKSPPAGSAEVAITTYLSRTFPEHTLNVVATDESLNCFVSKGFENPDVENVSWSVIHKKLATIQVKCVGRPEELRDLGLSDFSPAQLARNIDNWMLDSAVETFFQEQLYSQEELVRRSKEYCSYLEHSSVPSTLVHGDFSVGNVGVRDDTEADDGLILFDWQYACIAHPFCDIPNTSSERLQDYFSSWKSNTSFTEAEQDFTAARVVAWMARMVVVITQKAVNVNKRMGFMFDYYIHAMLFRLIEALRDVDDNGVINYQ